MTGKEWPFLQPIIITMGFLICLLLIMEILNYIKIIKTRLFQMLLKKLLVVQLKINGMVDQLGGITITMAT